MYCLSTPKRTVTKQDSTQANIAPALATAQRTWHKHTCVLSSCCGPSVLRLETREVVLRPIYEQRLGALAESAHRGPLHDIQSADGVPSGSVDQMRGVDSSPHGRRFRAFDETHTGTRGEARTLSRSGVLLELPGQVPISQSCPTASPLGAVQQVPAVTPLVAFMHRTAVATIN